MTSAPTFRRTARTCESTVRGPEPSRYPQTSASSSSRVPTAPGPAPRHVDLHAAGAQQALRITCRPFHPAEQRPHPRGELPHAEGLAKIVVGADLQADHEVGLRGTGRQHDHRDRAVPLDLTANLQAVEAWEHQVENHRVRPLRSDQPDRARAVLGHGHAVAVAAKSCCYCRGKLGLVLYHHDLGHIEKISGSDVKVSTPRL